MINSDLYLKDVFKDIFKFSKGLKDYQELSNLLLGIITTVNNGINESVYKDLSDKISLLRGKGEWIELAGKDISIIKLDMIFECALKCLMLHTKSSSLKRNGSLVPTQNTQNIPIINNSNGKSIYIPKLDISKFDLKLEITNNGNTEEIRELNSSRSSKSVSAGKESLNVNKDSEGLGHSPRSITTTNTTTNSPRFNLKNKLTEMGNSVTNVLSALTPRVLAQQKVEINKLKDLFTTLSNTCIDNYNPQIDLTIESLISFVQKSSSKIKAEVIKFALDQIDHKERISIAFLLKKIWLYANNGEWNGKDGESEANIKLGKDLLSVIHNTIVKLNEEHNNALCEMEFDKIQKVFENKKMEAIKQAKMKKIEQMEGLNNINKCFDNIMENKLLTSSFIVFLDFPGREELEVRTIEKALKYINKQNESVKEIEKINKKIEEIDSNFEQQTEYKKIVHKITKELTNLRFDLQTDIDEGVLNLAGINKPMIKLTTVDTTEGGKKPGKDPVIKILLENNSDNVFSNIVVDLQTYITEPDHKQYNDGKGRQYQSSLQFYLACYDQKILIKMEPITIIEN